MIEITEIFDQSRRTLARPGQDQSIDMLGGLLSSWSWDLNSHRPRQAYQSDNNIHGYMDGNPFKIKEDPSTQFTVITNPRAFHECRRCSTENGYNSTEGKLDTEKDEHTPRRQVWSLGGPDLRSMGSERKVSKRPRRESGRLQKW